MVQIKRSQILDNNLTGASFHIDLGFYDETHNYSIDDIVSWKNEKYKALNNITGTDEGDLTNTPDISTLDWSLMVSGQGLGKIFSIYPDAIQVFDATRITVNFNTVRQSDAAFSLSAGEVTVNTSGIYIVSLTATNDNQGAARCGSQIFVQVDTGSGYVDVPSFEITLYNRNKTSGKSTGSMSVALNLSASDKIRCQTMMESGSGTLETHPTGYELLIFN